MISDERREVAARLRAEVSEGECIDYAVFRIINDVLGVNDAWGAKAARILADLIDPTCHIVCVDDTYNTPETGRVDEWHYECSKCGIELDDNDTDVMDSGAKPFDYCPNCGARVVH
jgi:predicted RNA-binding Zn-ribbon protein involved in translation (DUF1610 family)